MLLVESRVEGGYKGEGYKSPGVVLSLSFWDKERGKARLLASLAPPPTPGPAHHFPWPRPYPSFCRPVLKAPTGLLRTPDAE